ncbi:putative Sensory Transduction Protein Kinase [Rhodospirillaceae bacterium LM-1]|nr:putative Sensory Transduction Protein Kinase [Rhodospirillaceae bacterium LM-1]
MPACGQHATMPGMNSLRRKIIFGYLAVGLFVFALSLAAIYELWRLERDLATEESLYSLVDAVMEARRFEKNYILYQGASDLEQNALYVSQASDLLGSHAEILSVIDAPDIGSRLAALLRSYSQALDVFVKKPTDANEALLRASGKEMTETAHQLAAWRRSDLHRAMTLHRYILIGVVAGGLALILISGTLVSLGVTRPLRQMQRRMEEIASGERMTQIDLPSNDAEIRSLTDAFNRVLGELELRSQQMLVSQKLASLGVMLSGVAHELNNPLSNISTSCQILLEEGKDADPEFLRWHLAQMDEQTERAKRIVASLLDFSRHQSFMKEHVALKALAEETLSFVRGQMPSGTAIDMDIPDDLTLPADRQRLQQILINLLKNAAEACGPEGQVRLRAWTQDKAAMIEVADNGSGIPASDLSHIFDPFFTTKEVGKGSGLGLFIVHDIVKKHGGAITVTSPPKGGTEFLIRLPLGDNTIGQT